MVFHCEAVSWMWSVSVLSGAGIGICRNSFRCQSFRPCPKRAYSRIVSHCPPMRISVRPLNTLKTIATRRVKIYALLFTTRGPRRQSKKYNSVAYIQRCTSHNAASPRRSCEGFSTYCWQPLPSQLVGHVFISLFIPAIPQRVE
jgi:hypothetical protein